nr:uncharacterized protein CTRU02_11233 [Colletotrichum truncatum]KAF6785975.1 hypothetical protein CTRU02_11233 [Colletotrichum truncatum]
MCSPPGMPLLFSVGPTSGTQTKFPRVLSITSTS